MPKIQARSPQSRPRDVVRSHVPLKSPVFGAKSVGSFVPRLTRHAFEKFGFSAATLLTDWETIVGPALARYTAPERLKWPKAPVSPADSGDGADRGRPGATLVLGVDPGRALDIQYRTQQIIERINAYFGYRAVAELRIVQTPIRVSNRPTPPLLPRMIPSAAPPAEVAAIADEGLRTALARMAAGVTARSAAI